RKPAFENLTIAIVGDIRHSRVARSAYHAFRALGVPELRIVAPPAFMPEADEFAGAARFGSLKTGLKDVDVVMMLRIQKERMTQASLPDGDRYFAKFGLTPERLALAKPDAIVMHPQPMNRGIEIASDVAAGAQPGVSSPPPGRPRARAPPSPEASPTSPATRPSPCAGRCRSCAPMRVQAR